MRVLQLTIALVIATSSLVLASPRDLKPYGIEDPASGDNSPSCGGEGAGTRVDRAYGSKCFVRKVECDGNNAVISEATCANDDEVYISDDATTCDKITSTAAQTACGVTVDCKETEMAVHVTDAAIWNQIAAPLQFGTTDRGNTCNIDHDADTNSYNGTLSLLSSGGLKWDTCGATRSVVTLGNSLAVKYEFDVRRHFDRTSGETNSQREEETHGATITREKCFMGSFECYYKADGTVSSSYKPTAADALTKSDENTLEFEMYPINCPSDPPAATDGNKIETQTVFVTDKVCFETAIKSNWHQDIRLSTTNCWATPNAADAPADTKYQLSPISGSTNDATFSWDCHNGFYKEKFSFDAFRFQSATNGNWDQSNINDPAQYAQTIHIHCEVNACAKSDITSGDCVLHGQCPDPDNTARRRRAVSDDMSMISKLTKGKTFSKMYVIQPETPVVTYSTRYNLLSDSLSMAMFATGCIFAVVALGLLIVMKRAKNQMKYRVLNVE